MISVGMLRCQTISCLSSNNLNKRIFFFKMACPRKANFMGSLLGSEEQIIVQGI